MQKLKNSEKKFKKLKSKEVALLQKKLQILKNSLTDFYNPNGKQLDFHKAGKQSQERLFLAGNRCGKTFCGAMEMAMHLTGSYPEWWSGRRFTKPIKAWASSVTTESTRDILQVAYLGDERQNIAGTIPKKNIVRKTMRRGVSDAVDTVYIQHNNETGSVGISSLGFKSYDQGREKFQGTSRDFIHLDEEPEMELYAECLLRTLDVNGSIILTMTPLKGMTEVCEHFLQDGENEQNRSGKVVIQATWDDNKYLNENEKNRLRKSLSPHEIEAREKGVPSLGSGKTFPIKESQLAVEPFVIPPHFKRAFGIDFGWTNPTAIVWGAYDVENDILYIYDCYHASERSPAEHAEIIKAKGKWINGVCDPAGQGANQADGTNLIDKYTEHGVRLTKADNSVEVGLMEVLERMQSGRLKVFSNLESWWKEFRLYRRNSRGQIVKKNDHLMDATRYLLVSGLTLATQEPSQRPKPLRSSGGSWATV